MLTAVACSLVAPFALAAHVDADLEFRGESRAHALAAAGTATDTRTELLAAGRARLAVDAWALRLTGTYAPRLSTSDVEDRPAPVASHELTARLETHHGAPWSAEAEVSATRGWTDPLADPWRAMLARDSPQAAPPDAVSFEAARAGVAASIPFDLLTTLAARGAAWTSGGADDAARGVFPTQRGAAGEASLMRRVSSRDTVSFQAAGTSNITELPYGVVRTGWVTASAGWRRRITRAVDGWARAGAGLAAEEFPAAPTRGSRLAVGGAGLGYEMGRTSLTLEGRMEPYVDRFTAAIGPMAVASASLRFRWSPRLALAATGAGGARLGGETSLASAAATGRVALGERTALELSLVGRWQHERSPALPSYRQGAVLLAMVWNSGPL